MFQPTQLTEAQRQHLAVAEEDGAQLRKLLRRHSDGVTLDQAGWLKASALATAVADQLDQIAIHAPDKFAARIWHTHARLVRDTAARHELAADLAPAIAAHTLALAHLGRPA